MTAPRAPALLLAGLLAACGGGDDGYGAGPSDPPDDGGGSGSGTVVTVTLSGTSFSPATLTIDAGTTVRWRSPTVVGHTVTPDGHTAWTEFAFGPRDTTFSVLFSNPGTYPYYCVPHRADGMTGQIVVRGGG